MADAGYSETEAQEIKGEVDHYEKVREEVKLASGDYIDMKMYEPAMRHLLDTYIRAEESEKLSAFDDMSLVELIVERGEKAVESLPKGIRRNKKAMAETIENNVRRLIIDEMAVNPKYYEKMSQLLDALIQDRKREAMNYKAYLAKIVELTRKISKPETQTTYPAAINSPARRALYDNLDENEDLAVELDKVIRYTKKDAWRGNRFKEREVVNVVREVLARYEVQKTDEIIEIVKNQRDY
jgi:type I restriction enzyme R subunit